MLTLQFDRPRVWLFLQKGTTEREPVIQSITVQNQKVVTLNCERKEKTNRPSSRGTAAACRTTTRRVNEMVGMASHAIPSHRIRTLNAHAMPVLASSPCRGSK